MAITLAAIDDLLRTRYIDGIVQLLDELMADGRQVAYDMGSRGGGKSLFTDRWAQREVAAARRARMALPEGF